MEESPSRKDTKDKLLYQSRIDTGQERLVRDAAAWQKSVENSVKGVLDMRYEITMLTQTSLVMQLVGAKNLPVKIVLGKLKKAMAKHGLSNEVVRQIPVALADSDHDICISNTGWRPADAGYLLRITHKMGLRSTYPLRYL